MYNTENAQKLNEALASLIEKSIALADKGEKILVGDLPNIAQQLIQWTIVSQLYNLITSVVFMGVFLYITYKVCKYYFTTKVENGRTRYDHYENGGNVDGMFKCVGIMVCLATLDIIGLCVLTNNICDITWVKAWLYPKLFLIEYAAHIIK